MDCVDDSVRPSKPGPPSPQDARLGTMGVHDYRRITLLYPLQDTLNLKQGPDVYEGIDLPDELGDEKGLHSLDGPGLRHQNPFGVGYQIGAEAISIQMSDGKEGILLGPAHFQLRDDMDDRHRPH